MNTLNPVRKWAVIFRLHSVFFVILPYLLGVLVAVFSEGYPLKTSYTLIGFIPLLFNHFAANLLSDIQDFRKGIDVKADFFSGAIVRGWISTRQALLTVIILFSLAFLTGIYLVTQAGMILLPFFILGCLLGIFYSTGNKYAFKYNVTGEFFIFLGFGLLIPEYGYLLNTGELSLLPAVVALPAAFLIAAVKHANNWIAAFKPGNLEKGTTASLIGHKASRLFYIVMILVPYILVILMASWGEVLTLPLPTSLIITLLSLPVTVLLWFKARNNEKINPRNRVMGLDSLTAMLYIAFIMLSCISIVMG